MSRVHHHFDHSWGFLKGLIGTAAPGGGFVVSLLAEIEAWLRIASLLVGIAVGLVTLWSLLAGLRRKKARVEAETHRGGGARADER